MMARYSNRFVGHIEPGDPRTPVTVAGGCRWPTVPPFRLQLGSTNATGLYAHFNHDPVLLQLDLSTATHNNGVWVPTLLPFWLYSCKIEKLYNPGMHPRFQWWVSIMLQLTGKLELAVANRSGKCNVNVRFGNQIGGWLRGRVGSEFGFRQVEHDQIEPPS